MDYIILSHLGLGDQFVMNGFVQYVLKEHAPKSIRLIAYDNYQNKTLDHLYSDVSNVIIHRIHHPMGLSSPFIESLNGKPFQSTVYFESKPYCLLNFGIHSQYRTPYISGYSWADSFYIQGMLDPSIRFSYFTLPSDMNRSEEIYTNVIQKIGKEYIVVNDDPIRDRNINKTLLKSLLEKSGNIHLPIVYLGIQRYNQPLLEGFNNVDVSSETQCESLLDLWKLIQNAKECHLMDSSIACMADVMPNSDSIFHLHDYITDTNNPDCVTHRNKNWNVWFKKDLLQ